jgi:Holliday junction resolvase RusA-like endonuclease
VGVNVTFYGARPNADIDNLLKSVLDAIQGVLIVDDKQVAAVEAQRMTLPGGEAHTVIVLSPYRNGGP